MPRRRHLLPWLSAILFLLNAAIVAKLFRTEYLSQTGTVEGAFVSYARYARDHWPDLGWCRFWYGGMPFQNVYPPALHLSVAGLSYFGHLSAGLAFHIVVALMYSLGPVTLFWMAARLTRSASWSFYAALLYSLISPSAFLVPDIGRDLGSLFWAQRLHTTIAYGDSPHVCSLTLIPLAIAALDLALAKRRPVYYALAALALASVPLTNWPGAIVLACAVLAYGLTLGDGGDGDRWRGQLRRWMRIAGTGALAYALAIPWMPPSTILNTQADVQGLDPANRFGARHLVYMAIAAACVWLLLRLFSAMRIPGYLRFFLLFFGCMAAITLGWYWFHATLLAQPNRFHLGLEMGFTLSLVFAVRLLIRGRAALARPVALAFAILCIFQVIQYESYARRLLRSIDMTQTSEYKTARWFDRHMRESRVMVPGSTTFWLNAFTDTPQLAGCCLQSVLNQTIPFAVYGIDTDINAEDRAAETSILWFKALGVRAVAVSGPRSTEVYKPFYHPHKFDGRLPVLWRDGDDVIYGVPSTYYSLAHAFEPNELVERTPLHGVDTAPLIPFVAAMDRPGAPPLSVRWPNNETIVVSGNLHPSQVVEVEVVAHRGWHATVGGLPRPVFADKLGFLAIMPGCDGSCTIELHYDGGTEMTAAQWINHAAIAGTLLILFWFAVRKTRSPLATS
jgi:hypothetical protein